MRFQQAVRYLCRGGRVQRGQAFALLEQEWVLQSHHAVDEQLLSEVLRAKRPEARAAATQSPRPVVDIAFMARASFRVTDGRGGPPPLSAEETATWQEALADPAIQKRFTELGLDVAPRAQQTPEGLAAFQKAEIEKWWPIIKAAKIKAD